MDKYLYKLHIKGIQHIGIPTQKYQETLDFYRSLGFEIINQENYQGHRVAFLRIHNVMLEVYESETTADATGSIDHIALSVEKVDQLFRKMQGVYRLLSTPPLCTVSFPVTEQAMIWP